MIPFNAMMLAVLNVHFAKYKPILQLPKFSFPDFPLTDPVAATSSPLAIGSSVQPYTERMAKHQPQI